MIKKEIRALLRSPKDLKVLTDTADGHFLETDNKEQFPILDDILCLLNEEERNMDLGDENFYDNNYFGERNFTDKNDIKTGVEDGLKALLNIVPKSAMIIDVGSGSGRISNYIGLEGYNNAVSLDYSLPSLKMVKKNSKNVCIWGNILHLPFESNSFDFVICSGVIHHTPDPHLAFTECVRILKPGGIFYVRLYNKHSLYGYLYNTYGALLRLLNSNRLTRGLSDLLGFKFYKLVRKLFFNLSDREDRILKAGYGNLFIKKMVYFFSEKEIKQLMKKQGIQIISARTFTWHRRMHCYVGTKSY